MMADRATSVENSFTGGLKTEFTGLNFPENACTDTQNCVYSIIGNVERRGGINFETNYIVNTMNRTNGVVNSYRWLNVGGDGATQVVVKQVGGFLYFYLSTSATILNPVSTQKLASVISLSNYLPSGSANNPAQVECQFAQGNGYLFVYHPYLDPFYCTYSAGNITASVILVQTRDFLGVYPEPGNPAVNARPSALTTEHNYNLQNQGWTGTALWSANVAVISLTGTPSSQEYIPTGSHTYTVAAGLTAIQVGQYVNINWSTLYQDANGYMSNANGSASGTVTAYSGTSLTINVNSTTPWVNTGQIIASWGVGGITGTVAVANVANTISTFQTGVGLYPSNADIWYTFKNSSDVFSPSTTYTNVNLTSTQAPQGHFILPAFNQDRATYSGISGVTAVSTQSRPRTGTWFQGRVWYTGVDASQNATGDVQYYTWTENLYFSQIITSQNQFGRCYQQNDPTAENLFDLLPDDGGVITIPGSGAVNQLWPIQNGMLVFAANGIWFITGSQGIGFAANDYTITKISAVRSMSSTSFVDVLGWPTFWNEEGIYSVSPSKQGNGIEVDNMCVGTIQAFYNKIPLQSKRYARGDYDPINFVITWTYRTTNETGVTDRYEFDGILNYGTVKKAFYPYTLSSPTVKINGVRYVMSPGGSTAPAPVLKYIVSYPNSGSYKFTFAEENDFTTYTDFHSYDGVGVNFTSYFITGYKLHGQAILQWQPEYVYVYSDNSVNTAYKIQGLWDYSTSGNSGKFSTIQVIYNNVDDPAKFRNTIRRHRIRGVGMSLQLKFQSVDGQPFNVFGWSIYETQNKGP